MPKHPNSAPFDHNAAMPMLVPIAHSAPVKCDLPLSDRTGDAAPRSVKVVEGSERLASEGYKGLRTQHDSLPVKVKTTRGVAANQGNGSLPYSVCFIISDAGYRGI